MNGNFLTPPPPLNQAFESGSGSSGPANGITRRSFLKRTGAASVATLVAWNATSQTAKSENEQQPVSASWWVMRCSHVEERFVFDGVTLNFAHVTDEGHVGLVLQTSVGVESPEVGYNWRSVTHDFKLEINSEHGNFTPQQIYGWASFDVFCDGLTGVITSEIRPIHSHPWPSRNLEYSGRLDIADKYYIFVTLVVDSVAVGANVNTTLTATIIVYDRVIQESVAEIEFPIHPHHYGPFLDLRNRFTSRIQ